MLMYNCETVKNSNKGYTLMNKIKDLFSWMIAIFIAFIIINIICFCYERPPGWRDTPKGASLAVREPYCLLVHGTEGYAITRVDKNGYLNPDKPLADKYILMLGASHTQGKEISPDKKYSVLVNDFYYNDDYLHTYNISCDGSFLPSQLRHFKAALEAFPDAELVTIEIPGTDYSVEDITTSMDQPDYDPADSAIWFEHMSFTEKAKNTLKDYVPMLSKIKKSYLGLQQAKNPSKKQPIDPDEYEKAINQSLSQIRSECDIPIVFIYHPETVLESDGTMSLEYSKTWEIFKSACINNDIDVIDCGDEFLENYEASHKLPYGFANSTPGTGHLNELGHKILADKIIQYLEETK